MIPTNLELAPTESFFGWGLGGFKSKGKMEGARKKKEERKKVQGGKGG